MKRLRGGILLVVLLSLSLILTSCGGGGDSSKPGGTEKVTLKAFSAFAENNVFNDTLWQLQKKVEEKSGGRLEIVWGGGPEAIPTFQLAEAIKNGMVDLAWTAQTFNVSHIPVLEGAKLTKMTGPEERESGAFEFYDKLYQERLGAKYLGKSTPGLAYNLYTNVPVTRVADFKGLTIRVTPAYQAFVKALGASPVTTDPGEVYNALERKVVDGYGWPSVGIKDFGWEEVTKYVIEPSFYEVDCVGLVSLKAWEKLPADLQEILLASMEELEQEALDYWNGVLAEDRKVITERGVEVLELPAAEAEVYLKNAYDAGWEVVMEKDPELGPDLKRLISK